MKTKSRFWKIFNPSMIIYDIGKLTAIPSVLIYNRLKTIYVNKNIKKSLRRDAFFITANHNGFLDILAFGNAFWIRRVRYVATAELFEKRLPRTFFKLFHCIKIDKDNVSMGTFKEIKNVINSGQCVGVFPEGTVANAGSMEEFKSGVVLMAIMSKAPIVPIYIEKRPKWYNRQRVVIGDFLKVEDYIEGPMATMDEINNITKILQQKEFELRDMLK